MSKLDALVAVYGTHVGAEQPQRAGIDMRSLSIIAKDHHTDEHVIGYYNTGDRMKYWVSAGGRLGGRAVLVSPFSILRIDWAKNQLDVSLSKTQVEDSPDIDTHKPVSRQHEAVYLDYYGYSYYWGGLYLWGPGMYPIDVPLQVRRRSKDQGMAMQPESKDSHLRSTAGVIGYHIDGTDGQIGHVDGFVADEKAWAIRYVEVATRNWWPGKKVLVAPAWIERVSWIDSMVYVALSRETIQNGPEYFESAPITRAYEEILHKYYGWPPFWLNEAQHETSDLLASV